MIRLLVVSLPGNLWSETAGLEGIDRGGGGVLKIHVKASQQALKRPFISLRFRTGHFASSAAGRHTVGHLFIVRLCQGLSDRALNEYSFLEGFSKDLKACCRRNKLTNQKPFENV